MTAAQLAARLQRDLQELGSDAGWSTTPTADQPQGHFSDPIADAMEDAGVSDLETATATQLKDVRRRALVACLDRLERYYATLVDSEIADSGGKVNQKLSQTFGAIAALRRSAGASVAASVQVRPLVREAFDYTLGAGSLPNGEYDL